MQKTKTKILTLLLLAAMTLAIIPMVSASTGVIIINSASAPQPLPIAAVPAGGNISLNFNAVGGPVTFSGSQFYLLFSQDGLSQVSVGDLRYTPLFNVATVLDPVITQVPPDPNFPGQWTIGNGLVTGTTPLNIPGGTFYIKAFDGATTALAVTQGIPVIASFRVFPDTGSPSTSLRLNGNAFPANSLVNLTYFNPVTARFVTINNLTQTNALGQFNYTFAAPDIIGPVVNAAGDNVPPASNGIDFQATDNATRTQYVFTYTEMQRGLLSFGRPRSTGVTGNIQNATGIYGNLTDFTATVSAGVGQSVRIVGNWFAPGNATFKWDNSIDITPTNRLANGTGFFNTTVTVPVTGNGRHNITIVDANNVVFAVFLTVVPSLTVSPTSGPVGTSVTVNGFGFPAPTTGNANNATISFNGVTTPYIASAIIDSAGSFTTTFVVPRAPGGAIVVAGFANDTGAFVQYATTTFTITAQFTVSPATFANNNSLIVTATGTSFHVGSGYICNIDNANLAMIPTNTGQNYPLEVLPDENGTITIKFVGAGFSSGPHAVALYENGTTAPAAVAGFTVTEDPSSTIFAINKSVSDLHLDLNSINATLIAINGNTATLSTSIGTLTASISSIQSSVSGLSGSIASISGSVATVQTNLGTIQTSLSSLDAVLGVVAGDTATIKTSLGTITTSLASLDTKVTKIDGNVATVQTSLGTLTGTVTKVDGNVATIQTSLGTMQADIGTLKTDVTTTKDNTASLSPLVIVAIVLALVAAIAAIASIVLMRRKIAG